MEAEAESPVWVAIQAMASSTASNFTQAQIKAANLPHLTEAQITSIVTAVAAHDFAVEASKAAIKAFEAMKIATNEENTSQDQPKSKGDGPSTRRKKGNAKDANEKEKDAFSKAYDEANKAIEAAKNAIADADQAELGYASVVLKADPGPAVDVARFVEVARTVRIFGSGIFLDRTLPNRQFSPEYRFLCYSILRKFIVTLKESRRLDLLVSPKKEEILANITDLEAYGFYAEWLTVIRDFIIQNRKVVVNIDNLKKTLQNLIAKTSDKIDELQSLVEGYSSVLDQLTSYSNDTQNHFQTHFNINPPNLPVNNNA